MADDGPPTNSPEENVASTQVSILDNWCAVLCNDILTMADNTMVMALESSTTQRFIQQLVQANSDVIIKASEIVGHLWREYTDDRWTLLTNSQ